MFKCKYSQDISIKTKLLIFFLLIIVLSVALTSYFSYSSVASQLKKQTQYLLSDTIQQSSILLNDKFTTVFEQFVNIENSPSFQWLLLNGNTKELLDYRLNFLAANKNFNNVYLNNFNLIDSMYFYSNNGNDFIFLKDSIPVQVGIDVNSWFEKYKWANNGYYWLNSHEDKVIKTVNKRKVITLFKLIGNQSSELKGILLINLRNTYFENILNNIKVSPNGYAVLVSQDGALISKKMKRKYAISSMGVEFVQKNMGKSGSFYINKKNGNDLFVVFRSLKVNNWVIAAIMPQKDIIASVKYIKYISFIIAILLITFSTIIATIFANNISSSIRYLSKQVQLMEEGNLDIQFSIKDHNEVGILANGLKNLVLSVKNLLQKVEEETKQKMKCEFLALQAQINPHFLYNTLWSVKYLIDMKDTDNAGKMVSYLTRYFMIGISKGREIISIKEEVEHVKNYIMIQKMRYSSEFDYLFNIDTEILDGSIIKLTLQPLVENSIIHGIQHKKSKGYIAITASKEENMVIIEVRDNGIGISDEKLLRLKEAIKSQETEDNVVAYGLKNVNERIRLHFGTNFGIDIKSKKDHYTIVRLQIPYLKYNVKEENGNIV